MISILQNTTTTSRALMISTVVLSALALVSAPFFVQAAYLDRQLEQGMSGNDVSTLQTFLAADPTLYPRGLVTGYFGPLTVSAVSNFQSRNGISTVGRVGPITLAAFNSQMGNGGNGDMAAQPITSINLSASDTSTVINWTTNGIARGKVYYSTLPIQMSNTYESTGVSFIEPTVSGTLAPYDGIARTAQAVTITGLNSNTLYYYLVESIDQSNNVSVTLPAYFVTAR